MCFAPQRRALFRHFFDIRTSKSGPRPSVFNTFDFKMCFAPQRRALFRHLNFQKCSENGVFCTFCLPNVLRATMACTFSTSQLPKVVRSSSVLSILTWKCASRHNGVHFFMSHLASWLRTRRFSEPTFRPSGASNHWKNTVNRDFPIFSRIYLFFLLIFSLLSASSLLCVSTVHIVGSLASKLPSIILYLSLSSTASFNCQLAGGRSLTSTRRRTRPVKSHTNFVGLWWSWSNRVNFSGYLRWNGGVKKKRVSHPSGISSEGSKLLSHFWPQLHETCCVVLATGGWIIGYLCLCWTDSKWKTVWKSIVTTKFAVRAAPLRK